MYKWKIVGAANGQYRVQFLYNAEIMLWSENYASKAGAQNCIHSIKSNAPSAAIVDLTVGETGHGYRFEIDSYGLTQYMTRFRASNGEIMMRSEGYTTKQNALNCASSVKANCKNAPTYDESISNVA